jgi:chemotaxis protein CheD
MQNLIVVGLSEVKVAERTGDVLVAYSLGSCIGLALWDPISLAGGMAHVVLPSSSGSLVAWDLSSAGSQDASEVPGKYADTAVPHLVDLLRRTGCRVNRLRSWVAGGAHVLRGLEWPAGDIGAANARAVLDALNRSGVALPRMDVGGDYGRTMRLYVQNGRATVSSVDRGERDI